jgi:hypothetical protein
MLLFHHGGKTSSSSVPPGELTTVVVAVALQGKEYHVVAAVEGHELETPKTEQHPGLKRLLGLPIWNLAGSCSSTCSMPLPGTPTVSVSTRGVLGPTSKIVAACPSLDGLAQDGTQGGKTRLVLSCARGVRLQ